MIISRLVFQLHVLAMEEQLVTYHKMTMLTIDLYHLMFCRVVTRRTKHGQIIFGISGLIRKSLLGWSIEGYDVSQGFIVNFFHASRK